MDRNTSLDRDFVVSLAIAVAMSGVMVLYPTVAWLILESGSVPGMGAPAMLLPVLAAVGLLSVVAGLVLFRTERGRLREAAGRENPAVLRARLLKARIMAMVLVEVPAILGLVLTLLSEDLSWSLAAGGLALAASFLLWPSRKQLGELSGRSAGDPIEPA